MTSPAKPVALTLEREGRRFEATVTPARQERYDIGDISAAELKRATCATLGFIFAQVLTVDEMIRKLSDARRSGVALQVASKEALWRMETRGDSAWSAKRRREPK